jgi:hypothetical protein
MQAAFFSNHQFFYYLFNRHLRYVNNRITTDCSVFGDDRQNAFIHAEAQNFVHRFFDFFDRLSSKTIKRTFPARRRFRCLLGSCFLGAVFGGATVDFCLFSRVFLVFTGLIALCFCRRFRSVYFIDGGIFNFDIFHSLFPRRRGVFRDDNRLFFRFGDFDISFITISGFDSAITTFSVLFRR